MIRIKFINKLVNKLGVGGFNFVLNEHVYDWDFEDDDDDDDDDDWDDEDEEEDEDDESSETTNFGDYIDFEETK
jgi:hypothetical protein